jgi:hypothetical protein
MGTTDEHGWTQIGLARRAVGGSSAGGAECPGMQRSSGPAAYQAEHEHGGGGVLHCRPDGRAGNVGSNPPAWILDVGVVSGAPVCLSSLFIAALIAAGLAYELLRTAIRRPEPDDYSRRWALGVGIVLFLAAVVAWSLPWKLRPLPVQDSYMVSVDFNAIREAQQDYHEQHGTYASSFSALKEHGWRGDRLQASPQTGLASAALGGLNVEAKVVADGTDYGVIFRPVDWPKGGVWVQYLMTSDGTVYTREDPGDGGFLDSPPLNDPASNGWRKSEYLRAAAP